MMVYDTWDYCFFGLRPSSGILKNTTVRKLGSVSVLNYATIEESSVFRAVSVAALPLLRSAEVNTSLVARKQL
jgi:hypothetical protein